MVAFYKKMLFCFDSHITRVTVSSFGLEKFGASVQDVMVHFKLKHRKFYVFRDFG